MTEQFKEIKVIKEVTLMAYDVSIILPVYNEEDNLLPLFNEIKTTMQSTVYTWEIYFVDDASTDTSLAKAKHIVETEENAYSLAFEKNCGQSAAFGAGFNAAQGDIIVTLDADMQNDPTDIPAMLELYSQGYDMVIGWRHNRKDTKSKKIASKLGNSVRRFLTKDSVHDTGCSLKVMRADMAKKLPMQFKGMHRFLVTLMVLEGAKVSEVKVNHRARHSGVSKYGTWTRGFAAAQDLLAVNWMLRRIRRYTLKK